MPAQVRTPRLLVRGLRPTDREKYVAALEASWPMHAAWNPLLPPGGDHTSRYEAALAAHSAGVDWKGVAFNEAGELVAWVNFNAIVRGASHCGTAGWAVNSAFVGRGLMQEALLGALDLAFSPSGLDLHRVAAGIMPANVRSLRLAERCGFRREGYARQLVRIAGAWQDHVLMAKLGDEHLATGVLS